MFSPSSVKGCGASPCRLDSGTVACQNLRKTFCWLVSMEKPRSMKWNGAAPDGAALQSNFRLPAPGQ